jgi:nitrous oxidase accessory protein NosD
VIAANRAKGRSDAGGIYSEYFSYPVIESNWIVGNISDDDGGGIYTMKLGHAVIRDNYIAGNWTVGKGVGGIRLSKEGRARISNNIIVRNITGGGIDCVDSYMEVDNNIIMHNKGKASIRYSNHYSYFQPSVISKNIIRENENKIIVETFGGPDVIIKDNNTDDQIEGSGNFNRDIKIEGSTTIRVNQILFDEDLCLSMIETDADKNLNGLNGRVIRLNDFWSVIKDIESNIIYVWGDASGSDADVIEILSDYIIQ